MTEPVKCPDCNGRGSETTTCTVCDGKGFEGESIALGRPCPGGCKSGRIRVECETCEAKGFIPLD